MTLLVCALALGWNGGSVVAAPLLSGPVGSFVWQCGKRRVAPQHHDGVAARYPAQKLEQVPQPSSDGSGVDWLRSRGTCGHVGAVNDLIATQHEFAQLRQPRGHEFQCYRTEPASDQMALDVGGRAEGHAFEIRSNGVGDQVIYGTAANAANRPSQNFSACGGSSRSESLLRTSGILFKTPSGVLGSDA